VLARRVRLPLLLAYVTIVALAAWRHEIRPSFLDVPSAWARATLHRMGIPPGVPVFTTEVSRTQDAKISALCLDVRAVGSDGRVRQIYPPKGRVCPAPPPRLWVTGEQIALQQSATSLRAAAVERRSGNLPPSRMRHPELLLETIAEHFRARAAAEGRDPERYALLWTESRIDFRSGDPSDHIVSLVRWRGAGERRVLASWRPGDRMLVEHWPELSEP
jgi:hypothetical protein